MSNSFIKKYVITVLLLMITGFIILYHFIPDIKYYSVQLSSHDDGWEGFPVNDNPYVAEGSRFLFGYSCLFTPSIPIFFSGEEFNAQYKPLPNLAPDLFGKKNKTIIYTILMQHINDGPKCSVTEN